MADLYNSSTSNGYSLGDSCIPSSQPRHGVGSCCFPYTGDFRGVSCNTQSLYAYEQLYTIDYVADLCEKHDFGVLSETRETLERKKTLDHRLLAGNHYFSSYLDQFKGGVAIVLSKSYLKRFSDTDLANCWTVIVKGRIERLSLIGPSGTLHIVAIYLDPEDKASQLKHVALMRRHVDPQVHSIFTGDFNFVECESDRFVKASQSFSLGSDRSIAKKWAEFAQEFDLKEWAQPRMICETGLVCSRLDRVYSSLHVAHGILGETYATVLTRAASISAHSPLSFGSRRNVTRQANNFFVLGD